MQHKASMDPEALTLESETQVWVHRHAQLYHLTFDDLWTFAQGLVGSGWCKCSFPASKYQWLSFQMPTYDKCWLNMYEPDAFSSASRPQLLEHLGGVKDMVNLVLQYILPTKIKVQDLEVKLSPLRLYENDPKKFWPLGKPVTIYINNHQSNAFVSAAFWCMDETFQQFRQSNKFTGNRVNKYYHRGQLIKETDTLRALNPTILGNSCFISVEFEF